jgi:hypothetical protein
MGRSVVSLQGSQNPKKHLATRYPILDFRFWILDWGITDKEIVLEIEIM